MNMPAYIAQKVMDARDAGGVSAGQAKYTAFFGSAAAKFLYGKHQADTNVILEVEGYADCIVA